MSNILPFQKPPSRAAKSCMNCAFLANPREKDASFWRCGISGWYCQTESMGRADERCGLDKKFFEPRPPKPPGFWKRLGDAIIERLKKSDPSKRKPPHEE